MRFVTWLNALSLIVAVPMLPEKAFAIEEVELSLGEFHPGNNVGTQPVIVTNNTNQMLKAVKIECGFFDTGKIIAVGSASVVKIRAMARGFGEVFGFGGGQADSVECRVVEFE